MSAIAPTSILDLLTPTDRPYAQQWRARCRAAAAARRARAAKPKPRVGQVIVFDEPLSFSDGRSFDRLEVVANPRSHRTRCFARPAPAASTAFPTSRAGATGSSSRRRHERACSLGW